MIQLSSILAGDSVLVDNPNVEKSFSHLLKKGEFAELLDNLLTWGIDFAGKIIVAILIFVVGRFLITQILKMLTKIFNRRVSDNALKSFLSSVSITVLYIVLFMIIINTVGTKTVSIAAIIASAGLAIGLAVKDNLANFAGGVMILLNKPFRGGDYIEAQNMAGTVESIGILYTTLKTPDNKTIYIPNGPLSTGNIVNFNSWDGTRRIEIKVSVDYGTNVEMVKSLLIDIATQHPNVLENPKPFARMIKMNDSSIDFSFRVWTRIEDFWGTTFDLNETIYTQLNAKGFNIPFPQMTVHFAKDKDKTKTE